MPVQDPEDPIARQKRTYRYPFYNQCYVTIPLEWSRAPIVQVCANPALPMDYVWQRETWIIPNVVAWNAATCVLTITFTRAQTGTVLLQEDTRAQTGTVLLQEDSA